MILEILPFTFSVCKIEKISDVQWNNEFVFVSKTDEELSLVCPTSVVPPNRLECEDGWCAMRIQGVLEFTMVGILAELATAMANANISIFAISTFNTDYILVKENTLENAKKVIKKLGYIVKNKE